LFSLSRNRIDYMSLLFGRAAPRDTTGWGARDIAALLRHVDGIRADSVPASRAVALVLERVRSFGVPLSGEDLATVERFHRTFIANGPGLRFNSFGRAPAAYYPDYRRLLRETDRTSRQSNYLAHEADFQFVRGMQIRNLIVPVTGDFGGGKALLAVAAWLRHHGEQVSAFYTSNVEQYLFPGAPFNRFAQNISALPRGNRSVMIRSYFQGGHPQAVPGYHAAQIMQFMERFVALHGSGRLTSYRALVQLDLIPP
jgi:hypothetical protein